MSFLNSSASSSSPSHVPIQIDSDTHETGNRICMKMSILAVRARWTSATHPCARLRHTSLSEGAASWIKVHTLAPHGGVDPESTFERSPAREKIRHRVHGSGGLSPATSNSGCAQIPRAVHSAAPSMQSTLYLNFVRKAVQSRLHTPDSDSALVASP